MLSIWLGAVCAYGHRQVWLLCNSCRTKPHISKDMVERPLSIKEFVGRLILFFSSQLKDRITQYRNSLLRTCKKTEDSSIASMYRILLIKTQQFRSKAYMSNVGPVKVKASE